MILILGLAGGASAETTEKVHTETNIERKADGTFKGTSTTEETDAAGTTTKAETKEKDSVSSDGTKTTIVKTATSEDPKGLMNKTWSKEKVEVKADAEGNVEKDSYSKSVDQAGTKHTVTAQTEKRIKPDGTVETVSTDKIVTDPKGLGNKTVAETEVVKEKAPDGDTTTTITKKIDGDTIEHTVK